MKKSQQKYSQVTDDIDDDPMFSLSYDPLEGGVIL
jgi:hypothetical protein